MGEDGGVEHTRSIGILVVERHGADELADDRGQGLVGPVTLTTAMQPMTGGSAAVSVESRYPTTTSAGEAEREAGGDGAAGWPRVAGVRVTGRGPARGLVHDRHARAVPGGVRDRVVGVDQVGQRRRSR